MTLLSKAKQAIFGKSKLAAHADRSLSTNLKLHDKVRRRDGKVVDRNGKPLVGTVIQVCPVDGFIKIPSISVQHIDGTTVWVVPAEEYTKV